MNCCRFVCSGVIFLAVAPVLALPPPPAAAEMKSSRKWPETSHLDLYLDLEMFQSLFRFYSWPPPNNGVAALLWRNRFRGWFPLSHPEFLPFNFSLFYSPGWNILTYNFLQFYDLLHCTQHELDFIWNVAKFIYLVSVFECGCDRDSWWATKVSKCFFSYLVQKSERKSTRKPEG